MLKWVWLILFAAVFMPQIAAAQQAEVLIQNLADPDPAVRQMAQLQLARLGNQARPQIVRATLSEVPAISSAAARVLILKLPWYQPTDPPEVVQVLTEYNNEDEAERIEVATRLAEQFPAKSAAALLRLIVEDPSQDVCWKIEQAMSGQFHDVRTMEKIRRLDPDDNRPAAMMLVARANLNSDRPRALDLLRRLVQVESRRPTFDDGELDEAFDLLSAAAILRKDYDQAAEFRRLQAIRIGVTRDNFPAPVFQLFALHARYGPLNGFDRDVKNFAAYLGYPQMLYEVSLAYAHAGKPLEAMACEQAARAASLSTDSHFLASNFLLSIGRADWSRRELYAVLDDDTSIDSIENRISAELDLAAIAQQFYDDASAVAHFTTVSNLVDVRDAAITRLGRVDRGIPIDRNLLAAQIAAHSARLADARGDKAALKTQLDHLMNFAPANPNLAIQVVPLLKSSGRNDDADLLFQTAYKISREQLDRQPDNPEMMNNLAWLCVECDENLPEALSLASRAVAAEPENAAYLDTFAEANFKNGHADQAVKLESHAIELEPDDEFMHQQLERFRKGVK